MTVNTLNIATFIPQTMSLGPGLRAALWVQGCPFRCPGCIVPEWQTLVSNQIETVDEISRWIINTPAIEGLTISGGEPILQAKGLTALLEKIKDKRDINVISYTGYTLERLMSLSSKTSGIGQYLDHLDVLIDGPYIKDLDDNKGLRGSSNQRIHYLTQRLSYYDFENTPRRAEFHINNNSVILTGVPPKGIMDVFNGITHQIQNLKLNG
jgi:anaerobic ribonucleoside-triphosphate reductase activating protein